ncbi:helix-turn-helix domain-containing protein [Endothiovibrio diazotrophicus]
MSDDALSVRAILDRLKTVEHCSTDGDLAKRLEVSVRTLEQWVRRNSISLKKILLPAATRLGVSLEWLVTGRGPRETGALVVAADGEQFEPAYLIAGQLYRALQERGITADPDAFEEVVRVLHRNQVAGHPAHPDLVSGFVGAMQRAPLQSGHPVPLHMVHNHHVHNPEVWGVREEAGAMRVHVIERDASPVDWAVVRRGGAETPTVVPLSEVGEGDRLLGVVPEGR